MAAVVRIAVTCRRLHRRLDHFDRPVFVGFLLRLVCSFLELYSLHYTLLELRLLYGFLLLFTRQTFTRVLFTATIQIQATTLKHPSPTIGSRPFRVSPLLEDNTVNIYFSSRCRNALALDTALLSVSASATKTVGLARLCVRFYPSTDTLSADNSSTR